MKHIFEQRVFYADTDSYGVVWHGSYLRWMEMGRVYWTESVGFNLIDLKENYDIVIPVAGVNIRYKMSAKVDDIIVVEDSDNPDTIKAVFLDGVEYYPFQDPQGHQYIAGFEKKRAKADGFLGMYGDVYLPTSYGSIFAFFCLGLALISIGMFISSLTESQGMAAGICVVVMLFNYYCTTLADAVSSSAFATVFTIIVLMIILGLIIRYLTKSDILGYGFAGITSIIALIIFFAKPEILEDMLPNVMNHISLFERFTMFYNGIFDLTAIVYYLTIIGFFLFLCVQSLEKRRYNG